MNEPEDGQLMLRLKAGDQEALALLVRRYYNPLLGYLYRWVGDRTLAEDLVQDTFMTLLKQTTYQATKPFKPWLYAIATNLARNYFNSAPFRHAGPPLNEPDQLQQPDRTLEPEGLALQREREREIAAAFAALPEEYRLTLILRFYADLTYKKSPTP